MEGEIILKGGIACLIGVLLLGVGRANWRHRDSEAAPWLENCVLADGQDTLPRTRFDRWWRRIQAGLGVILGSFFLVAGIAIFALLGENT